MRRLKQFIDVPEVYDVGLPVYIIGGGKSLDNFDWSLLKGRQVLAINKAMYTCKEAQIGFFGDNKFYEWHRDFGGYDFWRFRGQHILTSTDVDVPENSKVRHIGLIDVAFSTEKSAIAAPGGKITSSGCQAINLAYLAGATKVILLGYDCYPGEYHNDKSYAHQIKVQPSAYARYIDEFAALAKHIKAKKIKVEIVNANPDSALKCFQKCEIAEAFA